MRSTRQHLVGGSRLTQSENRAHLEGQEQDLAAWTTRPLSLGLFPSSLFANCDSRKDFFFPLGGELSHPNILHLTIFIDKN